MLPKTPVLFVVLLLAGVSAVPAWAQRGTGAIAGKVVDQQGAALPGVTLTLQGSGMPGQQTFTTSIDGTYRFGAVAPGTYTITAELSGFATAQRDDLIVHIGLTVDLDLRMQLAGVQESVTVTGESPTVDLTSNTASVNFGQKLLGAVPLKRDIYDVFKASPGVVADEVGYRATVSAGGTGVRGTGYNFDGVGLNDVSAAYVNVRYFNFSSFDEVEVMTGVMPAEVTNSTGAFINIVTKSGGNKLSGGASAFYANNAMSYGIREDVLALGVKPGSIGVSRNLELPVQLGGPIAKDKAWFFGTFAHLNNDVRRLGFRLAVQNVTEYDEDVFGKITWQMTRKQRLSTSVKNLYTRQPHMDIDIGPTRSPEANYNETVKGPVISFDWHDLLTQKTFLEVRGGRNYRHFTFGFQPDSFTPTRDLALNEFTGSEGTGQEQYRARWQVTTSLSHYGEFAGRHDFKTGFDNVFMNHDFCQSTLDGQSRQLTNGAATFIQFNLNYPGFVCTTRYTYDYGGFVQDNWSITNRITLNLGTRIDHASEIFPAQSFSGLGRYPEVLAEMAPELYGADALTVGRTVLASWPTVSPRVGLTINLPTAKRTALKAGFGSYNEGVYGTNFNFPIGGSTTHRWSDSNNDGLAQPGEFGPPISTSIPARLYPSSSRPHWLDYSIGIERELISNLSAGVRFLYRDNKDIFDNVDIATQAQWIPVTVFDAGPDRVRGTGDDVGPVQAFDLPRAALGTQRVASVNPEGAVRRYKAVEMTANKRLANQWQMYSSLVLSRSTGNYGQSYNGTQNSGVFLNPNARINGSGLLDMDSPVQLKIGGSYNFAHDVIVAANYFGLSGFPYTRTFNTSTDVNGQPLNVGNIMFNAEPLGSRRLPFRNELGLNVQKVFKVRSGASVTLRLDGFNVLNSMPPLTVSGVSGPSFNVYQTYLPPGYYRVGFDFKF